MDLCHSRGFGPLDERERCRIGAVLLIFIVLVVGSGGLLALVVGLRGWRVDDHPLCRKCRYDLSGHIDPHPRHLSRGERGMRCPECGADLTGRRALRIGTRRRRPRVAVGGLFFLVLALGAGGYVGYRETRDYDWNRIKPLWLLKRKAVRGPSQDADAAIRTINMRILRDRLSPGQRREVIELALREQADLTTPWNTLWANLIMNAEFKGVLPREALQRYLRQSVGDGLILTMRKQVRSGGSLPARVLPAAFRTWRTADPYPVYILTIDIQQVRIGEREYEVNPVHWGHYMYSAATQMIGWQVSIKIDLPPGEYTAIVHCRVGARAQTSEEKRVVRSPSHDWPEHIVEWEEDLSATLRVLPADAELVKVMHDPDLLDAVRQSIVIRPIVIGRVRDTWYAQSEMQVRAPPINLAYEAFIRVGAREWKQPGSVVPRGEDGWIVFGYALDEFPQDIDSVDVILRPSAQVAEQSLDLDDGPIFGEEIVLEDVPLERDDGSR